MKIQSGRCSDEEALQFVKEYNELRKMHPELITIIELKIVM